jgi:hypothetical protein
MAAALFLSAGAARALMVPRSIPFSAAVKTAAGNPLPDVPVAVTFNIYGEAGTLVWTDSQTVTPSHGVVTTQIAVPDPPRFSQAYRLGVKIGTDPEMTPLLPLAAAPYALALPNVFVNRANGFVGVGTSNPGAGLEVATSVPGDGIRLTGLGNAGPSLQFFQGATAAGDIGLAFAPGDYSADALGGDLVLRSSTGRVLLQNGYGPSALVIGGNNVGIGAAPGASARLTVGGQIRSTSGGFRFPDGTTQTTAQLLGPSGPQGPQGPQGPPGPQGPAAGGTSSSNPSSSNLPGRLYMTLIVDGQEMPVPITLAAPFSITYDVINQISYDPKGRPIVTKIPGRKQFGTLKLSRSATPDISPDWFLWSVPDDKGKYPMHNVVLKLQNEIDGPIASWSFPDCVASHYGFQTDSAGMPTEEITLLPQQMTRTVSTQRGPANYPGLTAEIVPLGGSALMIGSPALDSDVTVVYPDHSTDPPVALLSNTRSGDWSVRVPLNAAPDLYAWFTTASRPQDVMRTDVTIMRRDETGRPLPTLVAKQAWPAKYSLVPCGDGGVVEDYNLVNEGLTRP